MAGPATPATPIKGGKKDLRNILTRGDVWFSGIVHIGLSVLLALASLNPPVEPDPPQAVMLSLLTSPQPTVVEGSDPVEPPSEPAVSEVLAPPPPRPPAAPPSRTVAANPAPAPSEPSPIAEREVIASSPRMLAPSLPPRRPTVRQSEPQPRASVEPQRQPSAPEPDEATTADATSEPAPDFSDVLSRWSGETEPALQGTPSTESVSISQGVFDQWVAEVRAAIAPCWRVDPHAARTDPVLISLTLSADRVPGAARVERGQGVAAERALRAVRNPSCHPWPAPPDPALIAQRIVVNFRPIFE